MSTPQPPAEFDAPFLNGLKEIFEEKIPFNKLLGLKIISMKPDGHVVAHLESQPVLIGSAMHNRLHGGVVSAALDTIGGLAALAALAGRHMDEPYEQRLHRFARLGTIDLRVDYLRPSTGPHFDIHAEVLRLGSRVATTRMELYGSDGKLLCAGAAAYVVS